MKKLLVFVAIASSSMIVSLKGQAQIPIADIIKEGIKKVIIAVDLKIQRLQNKTIWLQNAQKTLENQMSKLKLDEISDWVERQRKLYDDYFQELWKIKAAITYYRRVKEIIERQVQVVNEYKVAWALFRQDKNFTPEELDYISNIYAGMLDESLKSVDQLSLVIGAFVTQMSDAKRLEIINKAADNIDQTLIDIREFNNENKIVSLQRSAEKGEIEYSKKLYGL